MHWTVYRNAANGYEKISEIIEFSVQLLHKSYELYETYKHVSYTSKSGTGRLPWM